MERQLIPSPGWWMNTVWYVWIMNKISSYKYKCAPRKDDLWQNLLILGHCLHWTETTIMAMKTWSNRFAWCKGVFHLEDVKIQQSILGLSEAIYIRDEPIDVYLFWLFFIVCFSFLNWKKIFKNFNACPSEHNHFSVVMFKRFSIPVPLYFPK